MDTRHFGSSAIRTALAAALPLAALALGPATAQAQTGGSDIPPFFQPSAHINQPSAHIDQPSAHMGGTTTKTVPGAVGGGSIIYYPPYPYYYYPPYYSGYPNTTVIVNSAPVSFPVGNPVDGYTYYQTPPTATIVHTSPSGRTRAYTRNLYDGCLFPGYATSLITGQTILSPFSAFAGCPPYLYSRYVVSTPWRYLRGVDTSEVIAPWSAADPYIAANVDRGTALRAALADISRFWERGNTAGLRRRVLPDLDVAVFQGERFAYSLHRADFLALASDALDRVQTTAFRFTDIRERSDGLVSVSARQVYRSGQDPQLHTVDVRYTLVYLDGDWYLSAFSLAPEAAGAQ